MPMELLTLLKVLIMGIVEGLTEFLPVSSTGHLIVFGSVMRFADSVGGKDVADTFEIFIQLGAVLAVIVYFARDLAGLLGRALSETPARNLLLNILAAFVPAAVLGLLFGKLIKSYLFNPVTVALALIFGGIVILWIEGRVRKARTHALEAIKLPQALTVGVAQVAALMPGVSRSAATILGGLWAGLDRATALKFSFYLSIPTLAAATLYDILSHREMLTSATLPVFALGLATTFVVSLLVIRFFLAYVATHDLRPFAWYRIGAGVVVLALNAAGMLSL